VRLSSQEAILILLGRQMIYLSGARIVGESPNRWRGVICVLPVYPLPLKARAPGCSI